MTMVEGNTAGIGIHEYRQLAYKVNDTMERDDEQHNGEGTNTLRGLTGVGGRPWNEPGES
jgi:hypothetical protein